MTSNTLRLILTVNGVAVSETKVRQGISLKGSSLTFLLLKEMGGLGTIVAPFGDKC